MSREYEKKLNLALSAKCFTFFSQSLDIVDEPRYNVVTIKIKGDMMSIKLKFTVPEEDYKLFIEENLSMDWIENKFNEIVGAYIKKVQYDHTNRGKFDKHVRYEYLKLTQQLLCKHTMELSYDEFYNIVVNNNKLRNAINGYILRKTQTRPAIRYFVKDTMGIAGQPFTQADIYAPWYLNHYSKKYYVDEKTRVFGCYDKSECPMIELDDGKIVGCYENMSDFNVKQKKTLVTSDLVSEEPNYILLPTKKIAKKYKKYPFADEDVKKIYKKIVKEYDATVEEK